MEVDVATIGAFGGSDAVRLARDNDGVTDLLRQLEGEVSRVTGAFVYLRRRAGHGDFCLIGDRCRGVGTDRSRAAHDASDFHLEGLFAFVRGVFADL